MRPPRAERVNAPTENRNPRTREIDDIPTLEALRLLNAEDRIPAQAVAAVLPDLARLVDETARRIRAGGRLHYFGAGTSGRLAVMDAAELIPTFGMPPGVVVAHHAGGPRALVEPVEGVEDSPDAGASDAAQVGAGDVAIGVAASGRTPYVGGALRVARAAGAFTALVSANPAAELADEVDVHLGVDTGPEAIAGSTRLKAATAHKLVLNSLSTMVMVALGRTYSNLMVDVTATNGKLRGRLITILVEATGLDEETCAAALAASGGELKTALVGLLAACSPQQARAALADSGGRVRAALRLLG
ncbi:MULTISPECIES: N-acetylmuramic acid 6-phosphate etherase [unclassified Streptomyces]|uniref:N-acetylmuramic acid 6-phosphate etherase n=1 Tax=unclassified Streptomyces TaxID=2593676 RepID=UPI0033FC6538